MLSVIITQMRYNNRGNHTHFTLYPGYFKLQNSKPITLASSTPKKQQNRGLTLLSLKLIAYLDLNTEGKCLLLFYTSNLHKTVPRTGDNVITAFSAIFVVNQAHFFKQESFAMK